MTGIPYLFVPHWKVNRLMKCAPTTGRFSDRNHGFFPKSSPLLKGLGGEAVRNARVQTVSRHEHERYHNEFYDPPQLPTTDDERFRTVVFCAAKFIPPLAINMGIKKPGVEALGFRQLRRLRESKEVSIDSSGKVRDFLVAYVLDSGIEDVEKYKKAIGDFLLCPSDTAYDRKRQQYIARNLLSIAVRGPAADVTQLYETIHSQDLLHPQVPPDPREFIVDSLLGNHKIINPTAGSVYSVITVLHDRLTGVPGPLCMAEAAA